jgi:molybdopterin-guanine dinucleotide biosynthesis protein A
VYARSCAEAVRKAVQSGHSRLTDLLDTLSLRVIEEETTARFDPEGWSFFNVNTPEDLALAERVYREPAPRPQKHRQTSR